MSDTRTHAHALAPAGTYLAGARTLQRVCSCSARGGDCEACKKKDLQRKANGEGAARRPTESAAPDLASTQQGGTAMDPALRSALEPLYGRDFGNVRLHDDARSHAAAERVGAKAFTVGQHVHFGAGGYSPHSAEGRHLLAHELTHTVQQSQAADPPAGASLTVSPADSPLEHEADRTADRVVAGMPAPRMPTPSAPAASLQREPAKGDSKKKPAPAKLGDPKVPADVVLLMDEKSISEALTIAPGAIVLKVSSVDELAAELGRVQAPFKTLFVMSHSLASGDLGFEQGNTTTFVRPEKVAEAIKGAIPANLAPAAIDFRGCSLGATPGAMDAIRSAVGAKTAIGSNCFMINQANGPIRLHRGKMVRKRSDLGKDDAAEFALGMKMLVDSFKGAKNCIIDPSEDAYFRAEGKLVALWVNSELTEQWQDGRSRCYSAVSRESVPAAKAAGKSFEPTDSGDCKVIRVEGGPPPKSAPAPKGGTPP